MNINTLIEQRISCNYFAAEQTVSNAQVAELIRLATLAPSAYNSQNWRFVAVRSAAAKARLLQHAYGQDKVQQAAVTFIVCGRLAPHAELHATLQATVDAGIFDAGLQATMVHYATEGYGNNPQLQRDEAIRSASLAAMTLMLAAEGMGLASCPMIGFDAAAVAQEFGLGADDIPVMLLPVGVAASGNWPQKPRKPVAAVLEMV
ncbi:nitroreductase family protein [Chitinilyticum litopenaei]|uniref:nitroreductase family protein n=1 Tax=Chitinilyticum litopenaei TaxID=1121276 RepID=UPI0004291013|nr:nitroreductase family protein [Chitinilyticum litopenaei]